MLKPSSDKNALILYPNAFTLNLHRHNPFMKLLNLTRNNSENLRSARVACVAMPAMAHCILSLGCAPAGQIVRVMAWHHALVDRRRVHMVLGFHVPPRAARRAAAAGACQPGRGWWWRGGGPGAGPPPPPSRCTALAGVCSSGGPSATCSSCCATSACPPPL